MVSFSFSADEIKTAPPEVRRWMEAEIVRSLTGAAPQQPEPVGQTPDGLAGALASGTSSEMQEVFKRISSNSILARMFFELARDQGAAATPFHVVKLVDVMRHLQLAEAAQVLACLDAINQAFQQVRRDPQASLFALDEAGHIYLHDLTYHAIRQVWQQLVTAHPWPASGHMAAPMTGTATPAGRQQTKSEPAIEPAMRPEHAFAGTSTD